MQLRTTGFFPNGFTLSFVDLFAYSTRGIPGMEIIGIGKIGRSIKEKIIYLSRLHGVKIPPRRFVLCLEINSLPKRLEDLSFLELPLLLLYWSLAGVLPVSNLYQCLSSGKIFVGGELLMPKLENEFLVEFFSFYEKNGNLKLVTLSDISYEKVEKTLNIDKLLGQYFKFNVTTFKKN